MTANLETIRAALHQVPAHDRDTWVRMGMAIKSELGEDGFDLWDEWSRQDESYRERDARSVWKSISANGEVTISTLFHEAKRHGYKVDGHDRRTQPTAEDLRQRAEQEHVAAQAQAAEREKAAQLAIEVFGMAIPARADHPYLVRKGVAPVVTLRELPAEELSRLGGYTPKSGGESLSGRVLIAPVRNGDAISTLEFVDEGGRKSALAGGAKSGGYWPAQKKIDGDGEGLTLYLAEGVATALSIHVATGAPAFAALSCGNLAKAAQALRERYLDARIIVCGDLGSGARPAHEAARAIGELVAFPDFGADRPDGATDFNDLLRHRGAEALKRAIANAKAPEVHEDDPTTANAPAASEWPEPQPLTVAEDDRPYPLAALPAGIREAVAEVVGFVQCPVALGACSALSSLSTVGQSLANVRRDDGLEGPTSLYLQSVSDSGERKTTVDGFFSQPIREWEREKAEQAKPDLAKYAAAVGAWGERRAGIKARIRETARKGKDASDAERELEAVEARAPKPIRVPRLIHADATPEALSWSLARDWPSGGVMSSEAGIVFGGHAMGRDSVMRNLSLLNVLWDGGTVRVERRTLDSFTVSGARLTMGLAVQPETVRQFMEATKGLARGNGFAARFLIAAPQSTQGSRAFKKAPTWRHLPAFSARLRELLATPVELDENGGLKPPVLTLSGEARAVWIRFHDEVEAELRPGGDMAEVRDVASKAADNVARMAALFHLYAHEPSGQIGADAVAAAAAIVGWHLYQARKFLGDVVAPRELSIARRLDAWLVDYCNREGVAEVERRTVQNRGPNAVRGRGALDAALDELAKACRVREADDGKRKLVRVNPALLGGTNGAA
jgi:putative DNA primase/helicase